MKEWYEEAGSSLITKLEEQKKVDGFTFLQDFVLDNDNRSRRGNISYVTSINDDVSKGGHININNSHGW